MINILTDLVSPDRLKQLLEKLQDIRKKREGELRDLEDIFGSFSDLAQFYVQPNGQHVNPADEFEDEPISVVRSPIFETLNNFFRGRFPIPAEGRNQMFVLSDAGMGKTSLLMMLRLTHLLAFWPKPYECKLFKLGIETLDAIAAIQRKSNTVLLLDALDEDPMAWGRIRDRLLEILKASSSFHRVVISCRTQFFPDNEVDPSKRVGRIRIGSFICPMLFLSLFDDAQVDEYLAKRFRKGISLDKQQIKKAKEVLHRMGTLRFRPLLLAHIDAFLKSDQELWDEYSVFHALIRAWLLREEGKLRSSGRSVNSQELLRACMYLAWQMQVVGTRSLDEKGFARLLDLQPELTYMPYLDIGGRSLLNRNSVGEYRFSHYIIQEFLVVHALINGRDLPWEEKYDFRPIRATDSILNFLFMASDRHTPMRFLDFTGVSLNGISLDHLDFQSTTLRGARLRDCSMVGANFFKADLEGADLSNARCDGACFRASNLRAFRFDGAHLTGADFAGAKMTDSYFRRAKMKGVRVRGNDCSGSDFAGANLSNSDLRRVNFRLANLGGTVLDGARLKGALLESANFARCRMDGAHLSETQMAAIEDARFGEYDEDL